MSDECETSEGYRSLKDVNLQVAASGKHVVLRVCSLDNGYVRGRGGWGVKSLEERTQCLTGVMIFEKH